MPCPDHSGVMAHQEEQQKKIDSHAVALSRVHQRVDDLVSSVNDGFDEIKKIIMDMKETTIKKDTENTLQIQRQFEDLGEIISARFDCKPEGVEVRLSKMETILSCILWTLGILAPVGAFIFIWFRHYAYLFFRSVFNAGVVG